MFLELSRPAGDTSRWEKVFKRLNLLNEYYPLKAPYNCQKKVNPKDGQKGSLFDDDQVFLILRESLADQGVVFIRRMFKGVLL
jgi:hypothetical protein